MRSLTRRAALSARLNSMTVLGLAQADEMERKRRERAERFGIPVVAAPAPAPKGGSEDQIAARAKRFGMPTKKVP